MMKGKNPVDFGKGAINRLINGCVISVKDAAFRKLDGTDIMIVNTILSGTVSNRFSAISFPATL